MISPLIKQNLKDIIWGCLTLITISYIIISWACQNLIICEKLSDFLKFRYWVPSYTNWSLILRPDLNFKLTCALSYLPSTHEVNLESARAELKYCCKLVFMCFIVTPSF